MNEEIVSYSERASASEFNPAGETFKNQFKQFLMGMPQGYISGLV
jgi:hypothetical protein